MPRHDPIRAAYVADIACAKEEASKAGCIHKRDLMKHIRRMEKELRHYDRFHREAGGEPHAKRHTPEQPCKPKERPSFQLS